MRIRLEETVRAGEVEEVIALIEGLDPGGWFPLLLDLAQDLQTETPYHALRKLAADTGDSMWHQLAAILLIWATPHIEGAYGRAFEHARAAVDLDSHDVSHKEILLFFADLPDHLLPRSEALALAREILRQDPSNEKANDYIRWNKGNE